MTPRHLTLEEIAEVARLPEGDPRRVHLESCARCRTLRRRYEAFLAEPASVPADDRRDAENRLGSFLEREVAGAGPDAPPARPARIERTRTPWRLAPAFAWAGGLVAVTALVLVLIGREPPGGRPSGLLRGAQGARTEIAVEAPAPGPSGRVRLRWHAVAGADRYTVRFFDGELRPLGEVAAGRETVLAIGREAIAAAPGDTVLWRVTAQRGERVLAESHPAVLLVP
jgi:hypothetical protein